MLTAILILFCLFNKALSITNAKTQLQEILRVNLDARAAKYREITVKYQNSLKDRASDAENLKMLIPKTKPGSLKSDELFHINDKAGLTPYLWEGDIHLTDAQLQQFEQSVQLAPWRKRRQVTSIYSKWTNGNVYYSLDSGIDSRKRISIGQALAYISDRTCLNFIQSNTATNRIQVVNGGGCYSSVGMLGGVQTLSIGDGCEVIGTVAHEFTHALGVWHMQSRDDRDEYIALDLSTVPVGTRYNFAKLSSSEVINYTPYEYGSFMHYGANAFSSDFVSTSIIPLDLDYAYTMGNRLISFYDISLLNQHYNCFSQCSNRISCANGGEQNPADCSKCNCPLGYGGDLCNIRTEDGGSTLTATRDWQNLTISMGVSDGNIRDIFTTITYWVEAPAGQQIQLMITNMVNSQCNFGCAFNGIELKVRSDQNIVNPRFCCPEFQNIGHLSDVNPTPVIAFNRFDKSDFSIAYRYVNFGEITTTTTPSGPTPPTRSTSSTSSTTTTRTTTTTTTTTPRTTTTTKSTTTLQPTQPVTTESNTSPTPPTRRTRPTRRPIPTHPATRPPRVTRPTVPPTQPTFSSRTVTIAPTRATRPTLATTTTAPSGLATDVTCRDFISAKHCHSLMKSDFCSSRTYPSALIKFNCPISCGLCGRALPDCSDTYTGCEDLKRQGYCNFHDKMLVEYYCARTCGFCERPN
ncbi:unnamed protein product [Auanema sp. JU1783]|nr:unnamed protein product [Auanema sp. JU1783]